MKLKIIALVIALFVLVGCQVEEVGTAKPKLKPNITVGTPITTLPKAMDLSGHWEGKFSFTNNCVADATCRYNGKPGSVVMDLKHSMNGINITFAVDYRMFVAEAIGGGISDEMCPTIKEFGVLRGDFTNLGFVDNKFMFVDYFDNLWELQPDGNSITGSVSSDDPDCMGMSSYDIALSRK